MYEYLRVSLSKLGDALTEQGRVEDALGAFEESLGLDRRLRELLGDSPQSLRDLSVSIAKIGPLASRKGDTEIAKQRFEERGGNQPTLY